MEHRQVEDRPATSHRGSGDDPARFLRELRQLRDGAGLGPAELAARAHYPYDRIKAAEVGPTLPDLPVLSAYVRGCGGTTEEWEERWRSLTSAPTLPLLDARPAGCSTAASAGARIGSISPVAEDPGSFGHPGGARPGRGGDGGRHAVRCPAARRGPEYRRSSSVRPSRPRPARLRPRPRPLAAKSAGAKAGTAKVTAWETTTMRTAWSSASGPPRAGGQQAGGAGDAPARARRRPAARRRAAAGGRAGSDGGPGGGRLVGCDLGDVRVVRWVRWARSGGGRVWSAGCGQPVAALGAPRRWRRRLRRPVTVGRRSRGLSRTTVAALIAIAVCVLVALLAISSSPRAR